VDGRAQPYEGKARGTARPPRGEVGGGRSRSSGALRRQAGTVVSALRRSRFDVRPVLV
jgi:hypothetical protein